jgi:ribosome-binding protein aMBF1 (putative translation factor)
VITGPQLLAARQSISWAPTELAKRAKVPLAVVHRAESTRGEPVITIAQLNALMQVLRTAGASFPPPAAEAEAASTGRSAGSQASIKDV